MSLEGLCLLILYSAAFVNCRNASEWNTRIVYQLLTDRFHGNASDGPPCEDLRGWCGGTFRGVQDKLDYITGLGANAIWISPVVLNTDGGYHGYWAKNIFELDPHWGNEEDFKSLIAECHRRDIWIMLDVVPNHMGYSQRCSWQDDSCTEAERKIFHEFVPFNDSRYYHQYCEISWNDSPTQDEIERCRLAYLPDLNQTVPEVRKVLYDWIENMTATYGIDGYRIDTARHITMEFWYEYQSRAGALCMGEVIGEEPSYVGPYQDPLDSVINAPVYFALRQVFNYNVSMTHLRDVLEYVKGNFSDVSLLGVFADNHDFPRFLNLTYDFSLLKNALTYVLMSEGFPIIYYGTEQGFSGGGDPNNRESLWPHYNTTSEMYAFIAQLAQFRLENLPDFLNQQTELCANDRFLIFSRIPEVHKLLVIVTNFGESVSGHFSCESLSLAQLDGNIYQNIWDEEEEVTIRNGSLTFVVEAGLPKVYRHVLQTSACSNQFASLTLFAVTIIMRTCFL